MSDLAEFLLARIAEDQALARESTGVEDSSGGAVAWAKTDERWLLEIDPARLLTECEAKRQIIERARMAWDNSDCTECNEAGYLADDLLKLLALPYAGHPDYRDDWRP